MYKNTIIFLNGTSSSGKTTIAKAFQEVMEEPVLYVSNDKFIFMLSETTLNDDDVRPRVLPPLLSAFHQSLPLLGRCGLPMIVDHVIECREWLDEINSNLNEFSVLFVKVECHLEELVRRERERGDRKIGLAKWQLERVHRYCHYDYVLNSHEESPISNAMKLKNLYDSQNKAEAF